MYSFSLYSNLILARGFLDISTFGIRQHLLFELLTGFWNLKDTSIFGDRKKLVRCFDRLLAKSYKIKLFTEIHIY
jgi:hypothetical protein